MAVDWTRLPAELVEEISETFNNYTDYLHFQAVCRTWRSSIPKIPNNLPPQLPWLMLPQSQSAINPHHRSFFNLSANKFHFLYLPEASLRRHCGSSHGWLIIVDDSPTILVINPLTRAKTNLPPLSTFPNVASFNYSDIGREYVLHNAAGDRYTRSLRAMRDLFIKKVVLSSSPLKESNFVAVAIVNQTGDVAYCRNGDKSWTTIEHARSFSEDVIYFNGLFYAVNKFGQIATCDVSENVPKVSIIETPPLIGGDMQYLVSSGDELLLVTRYLNIESELQPNCEPNLVYRTVHFKVFRLESNGPWWERIRSLDDRVFFIGENSSLSLSVSDFSGCTGNCIYFTDDYSDTNYDGQFGEHDLGIFKLVDESIEPLPCYPRNFFPQLRWPPPLWVSPNPC